MTDPEVLIPHQNIFIDNLKWKYNSQLAYNEFSNSHFHFHSCNVLIIVVSHIPKHAPQGHYHLYTRNFLWNTVILHYDSTISLDVWSVEYSNEEDRFFRYDLTEASIVG